MQNSKYSQARNSESSTYTYPKTDKLPYNLITQSPMASNSNTNIDLFQKNPHAHTQFKIVCERTCETHAIPYIKPIKSNLSSTFKLQNPPSQPCLGSLTTKIPTHQKTTKLFTQFHSLASTNSH
jgi:hypothetical protein